MRTKGVGAGLLAVFVLRLEPAAVAQAEPLKAVVITQRGQVGVGTSAPSARLTIQGGSFQVTGRVSISQGSKVVTGESSGSNATRFKSEISVGNIIWIQDQRKVVTRVQSDTSLEVDDAFAFSATSVIALVGDNLFQLRSGDGIARMTVTASGNIGIGTTDPQRPLHIYGNDYVPPLLIEGAQPGDIARLGLRGSSAREEWQLQAVSSPVDQFRIAYSRKPVFKLDPDGTVWLKNISIEGSLRLPNGELFFANKGQIRSFDDNHRIVFGGTGNYLDLRDYGEIVLSSGAKDGNSTRNAVLDADGTFWLKRVRFSDAYKDPHPLNWNWLVWDRDSQKVYAFLWGASQRDIEDIRPLEGDFEKLLQLIPKRFRWKGTDRQSFGYIVEDVDELGLRDLVGYDEQGRPDEVNYPYLAIYLLELIKSQAKEIEALQKETRTVHEALCTGRETLTDKGVCSF